MRLLHQKWGTEISSPKNTLLDDEFNAKISAIELNLLLGTGKGHITTRMMGNFIPLGKYMI